MLVSAVTREELFRDALQGMSQIQRKGFCFTAQQTFRYSVQVSVKSVDLSALLVDFLSDVLTVSHVDKAVFCDVDFKAFSETEVDASISGYAVGYFDEDIKAVTYHEANIIVNKDQQLETMILFDI
jgi:SHS2 domain-containing protein